MVNVFLFLKLIFYFISVAIFELVYDVMVMFPIP